ncbi:MAG TPA: hypothetical protein VKY27_00010 [Bacteriovoracaceae bacterium]|nr:hypothetical protein [Bacteriovoracaceae bacterium]
MKLSQLFLITSLLLTLAACKGEGTEGTDPTIEDPTQIENPIDPKEPDDSDNDSQPTPVPNDGVPAAAKTLKVNIKYVNFTAAQKAKYEQAVEVVKKVVATKEFMDRVKNHKYGGKLTYVDNRGKTNAQIYQNILDGNETLQPTKNNAIDVEVELYYANTSTVGYTYSNSKRIWVNTKYFNTYTPAKVAGNLFHEWLHKLGYTHASSYSTSRDYSVPYAIGYMISNMGAKL